MRDHFDPSLDMDAGPLVFAPQHPIPPATQTQQLRSEYVQQPHYVNRSPSPEISSTGTSSAADSFGNFFPSLRSSIPTSNRSSFVTGNTMETTTIDDTRKPSLPTKRHVSEIHDNRSSCPLDCQSLQSSLKRVKLSCSPGELRLQRDLRLLPPHEWQPVSPLSKQQDGAASFSPSIATWVHAATQARLTLVDSLRLCLFLPKSLPTTTINHLQPPLHPQHFEWRMMIQIPRMFPHRPPVLSRVEGNVRVRQVIIHEVPPVAAAGQSSSQYQDCGDFVESAAAAAVPTTNTLSLEREPWCGALTSTIVWNKWSVVSSLSDLLDFLLDLATCQDRNSSGDGATIARPIGFGANASRLVSTDENVRPAQSLSSSSSWTESHHETTSRDGSLQFFVMEEHKFDDPTSTITMSSAAITGTSSMGGSRQQDSKTNNSHHLSFLPPNRFDVGYGKYDAGSGAAAACTFQRQHSFLEDAAMMDTNE